ncbi:ZIP-like iron-zinc transporter [Dendrothele bispora CBS 962.96]|uniref:ZIP-like iron-zinc transporter n=1 Tax=Dendrothele bispora (strain CBS 962.96) TaxID=1314807 RepID=A0A4S8MXM4_DENBC|nr:ZIP-like iron-zinc transporter [Dendrothele bispora CBS 962.96]
MTFRPLRLLLCIALLVGLITNIKASKSSSLSITDNDIRDCPSVQQLSSLKLAMEEGESPVMRKIFAWLFPFGPAWNSVLGTFYISSVPNFILAFIPAQINGDTLNTMTAFATGGLLSDVFLHLVPHSFMGEHQESGAHFVMVEEKRNILVGLGIFLGFAAFFFMEKSLRVLGGGEEDSHSHGGHSHSHSVIETSVAETTGMSVSSSSSSQSQLKSRNKSAADSSNAKAIQSTPSSTVNASSKLSAYLNLFGDFVHNITDGLAMAASFYASPLIGATTTLACFAHEIPHEIADYSILIRSGFTKKQAMQSQFVTAIGAFVGTFIGIAVRNAASSSSSSEEMEGLDLAAGIRQDANGLLGTTLLLADLVIPFVAGGFLYIGAVAVLPTLLADSKSGKQALREFAAMFFGVLCMFLVAWNE